MPGIVNRYPSSHVKVVKGPAWSALLVALGQGGDRIMMELLMNCGVFASLDGPSGICYQLSGKSVPQDQDADLSETPQESRWRILSPSCRTGGCRAILRVKGLLALLRGLNCQETGVQTASRQSPLSEAACFMREPPSIQGAKCALVSVIFVLNPETCVAA